MLRYTRSVSNWYFRALGALALESPKASYKLERKTAAVLAYLALEGPTSRSKLAGLLWPDSEEATARNNLAQTLRRLRRRLGDSLIEGEDPLRLSERVMVDALERKRQLLSGQGAAEPPGVLLERHDYDDCPEFSEWLWSERERLAALWTEAALVLMRASEAQGDFEAARQQAEELLIHNPLSEAVYRRLMRLHYLLGDRAAAVQVYRRCEEVLAAELGVEPLPETRELLTRIERDDVARPTMLKRRDIPLEVLRPPVLVGREEAWEAMEEAWEKGQPIYITGEPGVGKTRLAQEFVVGKGRGLYLPARPGHADVPFASAASLARTRMAEAKDVSLPNWVQRELSRILPELRQEDAPPAMQGEEDRLRFYQAYLEMVRLTGVGFVASISDDVQYYDPATVELGSFLTSQRPAPGSGAIPRYVIIYRRGELTPGVQAVVDRHVNAELAARVDLEPLDAQATMSLLVSLKLNALDDGAARQLSEKVYKRTGGNALFILETLRNLIETDRLDTLPESLPSTRKVEAIIKQRLERLSPTALRVAQAAAVLKSDFSPDLIGAMLQLGPLEGLEAWDELERAHILRPDRFTHDLVLEAIHAAIPASVKLLLERRAAEVLASRQANPLKVARHWLASGDELAAVPFLRRAAQAAVAALRPAEAQSLFNQILGILKEHDQPEVLAEVAAERARALEASSG
jgi:DNA-binding SARP family transcriptional activator